MGRGGVARALQCGDVDTALNRDGGDWYWTADDMSQASEQYEVKSNQHTSSCKGRMIIGFPT